MCDVDVEADATSCPECGYDFILKRRRKSAAKKAQLRVEKRSEVGKLQPSTWKEILSVPLDPERVITETIILNIWAVIWMVVFMSFLFLMIGSPVYAFFWVLALAQFVRIQTIQRDLSLKAVGVCFFGFITAVVVISQIMGAVMKTPLNTFVGLMIVYSTFMILSYLFLVCCMITQYMGKYFAICNRAAYDALMSEPDRGLADFFYGLAVLIPAWLPLLVSVFLFPVALLLIEGSRTLDWYAWPVLGTSLLWGYWYFPMGIAAVGLKRSANPLLVLKWSLQCLPDYLWILMALLPVLTGGIVVSILIGYAMVALLPEMRPSTSAVATLLGSVVAANVVFQYPLVILSTAMGLLARRHSDTLRWEYS